MKSTADSYYEAASENLATARWLHKQDSFYAAHYFSGLAVECILRAYLRRITAEFDARHDLYELAREARFFEIIPSELQRAYGGKFTTLNQRWNSNHRYFSQKQLLTYWNDIQAEYRAKSNRVEHISRVSLNTAHDVVNLGARQWQQTN